MLAISNTNVLIYLACFQTRVKLTASVTPTLLPSPPPSPLSSKSGEMYWITFPQPWPKVTVVVSISTNLLVCKIKWEPLIQSLQNVAVYCPSHGYYLIRFWGSFVGNCYFGKSAYKISDAFFQVKHCFVHISGMVGLTDVKRKRCTSVQYWV